jgi:hypothetical protein
VVEGFGPQQGNFYDHPYFGQLFLGTIFTIIGYPDVTLPTLPATVQDLEKSIGALYNLPRILMGVLAVTDTFLIYKIAERRYNRNVALVAAILFAVTPVSWLFRRMYLDPIQLPFLLTSILFALYSGTKARKIEAKSEKLVHASSGSGEENELIIRNRTATSEKAAKRERRREGYDDSNYNEHGKIMSNQNIILLLSSGIFLGLTIFTKIPAITLIPLIGFIIFTNNKKSFKAVGMWIIPVILIPMIWPIHALSVGDMEHWLDDVVWQATERPESSLINSLRDLLRIDPVLILLGSISFVYAALKRDYFIMLWLVPFVIFFYLVGRITYNYWVPLLPVFCIGGSVLIIELSDKVRDRISRSIGRILPLALTLSLVIFGLIVNIMLITADLTGSQIRAAAFVQDQLYNEKKMKNGDNESSSGITVISGPNYSWIFKHVFKEDNILDNFRDSSPIDTDRFMMVTDLPYKTFLRRDDTERSERLETLYDNTISIAKFKGNAPNFDYEAYPYFSIRQGRSGSEIDVRSNY